MNSFCSLVDACLSNPNHKPFYRRSVFWIITGIVLLSVALVVVLTVYLLRPAPTCREGFESYIIVKNVNNVLYESFKVLNNQSTQIYSVTGGILLGAMSFTFTPSGIVFTRLNSPSGLFLPNYESTINISLTYNMISFLSKYTIQNTLTGQTFTADINFSYVQGFNIYDEMEKIQASIIKDYIIERYNLCVSSELSHNVKLGVFMTTVAYSEYVYNR